MNNIHRPTLQLVINAFNFINKEAPSMLPEYVSGTKYEIYAADASMLFGASIIYIVTITSDAVKHGFQCEGGKLELGASKEQWEISVRETMERLLAKIMAS